MVLNQIEYFLHLHAHTREKERAEDLVGGVSQHADEHAAGADLEINLVSSVVERSAVRLVRLAVRLILLDLRYIRLVAHLGVVVANAHDFDCIRRPTRHRIRLHARGRAREKRRGPFARLFHEEEEF